MSHLAYPKMNFSLYGGKRFIGIFIVTIFLIGVYCYLNREEHPKEMSDYNRYELGVLNSLIEKKQFFRDSLKYQMDSVMLQLHKNTDYNDEYRYFTNRRMLLEKPSVFDPRGQAMLTLTGKI